MMYFTFRETVIAFFAHFVLGLCGGVVYECLRCAVSDIGRILSLLPAAWKSALVRDRSVRDGMFRRVAEKELSGVRCEICAFLFTLTFGISFLLLSYLFLDGVFRFLMLAAALFGLYLFEKVLGIPARRRVAAVFSRILFLLYRILRRVFFLPCLCLHFLRQSLCVPLVCALSLVFRTLQNRKRVNCSIARFRKSLHLCK